MRRQYFGAFLPVRIMELSGQGADTQILPDGAEGLQPGIDQPFGDFFGGKCGLQVPGMRETELQR